MSTIISTNGGAWAANSLGVLLPVLSSWIGWFYPCSAGLAPGSTTTLTDLSPVRQNATLSGAPVVNAGYTSFGAPALGQFVQTQVRDPGTDFSVVFVARSLDTFAGTSNSPSYVSNFAADPGNPVTASKGLTIKYPPSGGPAIVCNDTYNNAGSGALAVSSLSQTTAQLSAFKLFAWTAGTVAGVTTRTMYNLTDGGAPAVAPNTSARVNNLTSTFKFGNAGIDLSHGGLADFAHMAFANVCLTPAQLNTQVAPYIRANMTTKGITV